MLSCDSLGGKTIFHCLILVELSLILLVVPVIGLRVGGGSEYN